jgi:spore coat polysaccharide biosynthesis protein SpsF
MTARTVAVVQARTTSTRLPGKVLMDLAGAPVLARVLERLAAAPGIDEVVVATTVNDTDDPVVALTDRLGHRWFRGSEHDVLARYVGAAREAAADVVVRVTADCPLLDPAVVGRVVDELVGHRGACDYAGNAVVRSFPRGLDTEALFRDVLERVDRLAVLPEQREHVTMAVYASFPELFLRRDVVAAQDDSDLRWTVDHAVDLEVVRSAYEALGLGEEVVPYLDVVAWFRSHPEVAGRNADLVTWSPTSS